MKTETMMSLPGSSRRSLDNKDRNYDVTSGLVTEQLALGILVLFDTESSIGGFQQLLRKQK